MSNASSRTGAIPASLSFLTIYNPSFSCSDETLGDQILYYSSEASKSRANGPSYEDADPTNSREMINERLRQVGLAQGMVEFAKSFSDGDAIDSIETEKCRIILHELEEGWWILASINLTRIISLSETSSYGNTSPKANSAVEYSAREVCPPVLLLQQLLRAHQIFLLHHANSLSELNKRFPRPKLCRVLKRFWDNFLLDWNVLLCGNPAVDVFNGLKLAAGGELGIGVGEEEWGSGEREVLEGFIGRTDGLVDLIVSRFGDDPESNQAQPHPIHQIGALSTSKGITNEWQSGDRHPGPSDGVIFSGVGAITRSSIKSISGWMELLFRYGQDAYGVRENASATYRRKRKKPSSFHNQSDRTDKSPASSQREPQNTKTLKSSSPTICRRQSISPAGIPPPIVKPTIRSPTKADDLQPSDKIVTTEKESKIQPDGTTDDSLSGTETLMKYLSLGVYGSKWGIPARKTPTRLPIPYSHNQDGDEGASSRSSKNEFQHSQNERASPGHFMIGLQGDLDNDVGVGHERGVEISTDHDDAVENRSWNNRTMLRTLQVERLKRKSDSADNGSTDELYIDRLRVVVYVRPPFIFTFLFELQTGSLAMPSFYQSLHHQLGPLQRPLLVSTSPHKVAERLWQSPSPKRTSSIESSQPISDLVYDPVNLTIHTTIPNIPEPCNATGSELGPQSSSWSRVEALSVHSQILDTYALTRPRVSEVERTCKTNRGWWVVWMRLPSPLSSAMHHPHGSLCREAFLIRKTSDSVSPLAKKSGGKFRRDGRGSSPSSGWGAGKLADGIGIDTRQYIQGLLSLNR